MGVKGRVRINASSDEPTLLGSIDNIISNARQQGYINEDSVDIEAIIKSQNIEIYKEDMPSTQSGYLKKIDNRWIVGINQNHHIHRQRYTLAHEFAHYCLHKLDNDFFEDEIFFRNENQTSIEYAANTFAAKLLMPDENIKRVIESGVTSLKEISEKFNVSTLAVKYRVVGLGYKIKTDGE